MNKNGFLKSSDTVLLVSRDHRLIARVQDLLHQKCGRALLRCLLTIGSDEVVVECSSPSTIVLLGRGPAEAAMFGDGIRAARLPLERMSPGGHARVVVMDASGKPAWSNPVWLDTVPE